MCATHTVSEFLDRGPHGDIVVSKSDCETKNSKVIEEAQVVYKYGLYGGIIPYVLCSVVFVLQWVGVQVGVRCWGAMFLSALWRSTYAALY